MSPEDTRLQASDGALASPAARREAFEKLTQRRLDRAYGLAATILGGDTEAEDVVHDAALRAWLHWLSLRDVDRFDAWFDRIVINICRERLRHGAMASRKLVELHMPGAAPGGEPATADDALRDALAHLEVDHRIVVVLRFLDDLTVDEIAARTGLRVGTVKSRLHYGLRELRAAYDAALRRGGDG